MQSLKSTPQRSDLCVGPGVRIWGFRVKKIQDQPPPAYKSAAQNRLHAPRMPVKKRSSKGVRPSMGHECLWALFGFGSGIMAG